MVKKDQPTKERILEAAKEVFHRKGFDGARMQEIADTAGINKALLHYYFCDKETLFAEVFKTTFENVVIFGMDVFSRNIPFEEKLSIFLDFHISFLRENSFIPLFILNGIYERPDQLREMMIKNLATPHQLMNNIVEGLRKEGIELDNPLQLYINVLSLSIFPVVAKPILSRVFGLSDEQMNAFYEERKKTLPHFIMNAIRKP